MKLGDYLPEVPEMAKSMGKLGSQIDMFGDMMELSKACLLYTSPSPRD